MYAKQQVQQIYIFFIFSTFLAGLFAILANLEFIIDLCVIILFFFGNLCGVTCCRQSSMIDFLDIFVYFAEGTFMV